MRGSLFNLNRRTAQRFKQLAIASVKIKLLLLCCIAFVLVLLAGCASVFQGEDAIGVSSNQFSDSRSVQKGFALLINTWKRNDLLKQSIAHYARCSSLDSIHIVWSEPDPPSESLKKFLNHVIQLNSKSDRRVELKFDINKEDSLNNRFKPITDLKTDAVFSIDDDVIFPCSSVEFAFDVWRSAPDTMVGFVPRIHWIDQKGSADRYVYGGWWSVWWTGTYSMVLSKAAFFHKKYLDIYTNQMPASIREYVSRNRNCEDIAMSFLVANVTGAPPIWVKGKIFEIGSTGISSLGGHSEKRTQCVNRFVAEFRRMALVSTTVKAVDSRNIWFW
ncbi:glycosylinositol phosphorylceramide mannosyl transferase 1 isoform X1 [Syzygium oleosum]|uniref:glycosylinositol phosphorylceramide mannosyl transferase 1 isoform X1 n=1 Tax=Syzygium oleosum TaxID=219896 RepID=UPI0011D27F37|nr:glycosylinositol phosphorylceramide mannosyl transferase 1 isoform X1 [Syzygium oleosum]XP_056164237.1 glycosylinositol phosphorylceramide mannosyl transferase 1 isoform X1 [Syzygium oleosum]